MEGLVMAVPSVAGWQLADSPGDQPKRWPACSTVATVAARGRRDFAILTVLARLGLRACEVAALRLDDIDWPTVRSTFMARATRRDKLPLAHDVGEAIVDGCAEADRAATARRCSPGSWPPIGPCPPGLCRGPCGRPAPSGYRPCRLPSAPSRGGQRDAPSRRHTDRDRPATAASQPGRNLYLCQGRPPGAGSSGPALAQRCAMRSSAGLWTIT